MSLLSFRTRAVLVCVLFCSPSALAASRMEHALNSLQGAWEGERGLAGVTEHVSLIVRNGSAWLEVDSPRYSGAVSLSPKTAEADGSVLFTFPIQSSHVVPRGNAATLAVGRINILLNIAQQTAIQRVFLRIPSDATSKFFAATVPLYRVGPPEPTPQRLFLDSQQMFAYKDWREGATENGGEHLRNMFARLEASGFGQCRKAIPATVTPAKTTELTFTMPGTRQLYVIYSPTGDGDVTYAFRSNPPVNAMTGGGRYDYPTVLLTPATFFNMDVKLALRLRATVPPPERTPKSVPVTVFVFGSFSGPGCPAI